ncbi:MAG: DMT family transporter [Patescibacteria group bacterium]
MKIQNNIQKGILLALTTSVISGIAIFYSKITVVKIDPLIMATIRNLFVGFIFLCLILIRTRAKELKSLSKKNVLLLSLIGIIGGSIPFYLFFFGLKLIGAQSANVLHKTLFIWVALFAALFLNEKINKRFILAGAMVFAGSFLFTPSTLVWGLGEQLVLLATLFWSLENIIAKKVLSGVSYETVGLFRMGLGGLVLLLVTLLTGKGSMILNLGLLDLITLCIGGIILFFYVYTWYKSLSYAPAGLVTLILTFSLVVGNLLSGSFAGLSLSHSDLFSMILIAGGVIYLLTSKILIDPSDQKFK